MEKDSAWTLAVRPRIEDKTKTVKEFEIIITTYPFIPASLFAEGNSSR
jgi:hypothetical protein